MTETAASTGSHRSRARVVVATAVFVGTVYAGGWSVGPAPALGPFLDPVSGVWSVARAAVLPEEFAGAIPGLASQVEVVYDRRGVPHIWASTVEDAVRALGFVVARDRLFQLEIQTRAPQGTLTELVGPAALGLDRRSRARGLARSAEREMADLEPASESWRLLRAYAEGINAWIDGMRTSDLPFEYHLLGARPRRWEPVYSAYLGKQMAYTLAYGTQDLWRLDVDAMIGKHAADALFPRNSPMVEPIEPNGSREPRFAFVEPPPPVATRQARQLPVAGDGSDDHVVGSNNWAVAPWRTAAGAALLSGDPHLELTLPSIWYEVHIVVPGELDMHGVTLPGAPLVGIGFTRSVAWSLTNTGADVLDYYRETFDAVERPSEYLVDGEWRRLERRVEVFRDPHGATLATDTVYYTHRGPVRFTDDGPLSMRWTMLESPTSIVAFWHAAQAANADEWLEAMASYPGPAQNALVADTAGNIAIRSIGLYPIRPDNGDGRVIRDGSSSANDWQGYWPVSQYPFAKNPDQGFLASANQQPVDPATNDRYLGANWETPWRAMRINQLLRADSQVTPDAMRRYQTDPGNVKADWFVPAFLAAARNEPDLEDAAHLLADWDRRYIKDNERAVLFEEALNELVYRTWDELYLPSGSRLVRIPSMAVLAGLLRFPESIWWDDTRTGAVRETRDDVLAASLLAGWQQVTEAYGKPADGGWRWSAVRHANIYHLIGFPALSEIGLAVQGGPGNLSASSGNGRFGPSWRMVVELGPDVRAWATYPGGQSGNPASRWYVDRIEQWVAGELDAVLFPRSRDELSGDDVAGVLKLEPVSR
ncbi:MAG: penicillin acylase family protein [Gemmatimonadetes bacterium]|nr:penicillin acylase family protein [Gemmatimonadota bacterium]